MLRSLYPTQGGAACQARLPGRSRIAIFRRAGRLGLENGFCPHYLTVDEDGLRQLKEICDGTLALSVNALAGALGVSEAALRKHARKRGWR